ncbi:MAG: hypothetical protein WCO26_21135 [Deltaproteobacteria bacterium]
MNVKIVAVEHNANSLKIKVNGEQDAKYLKEELRNAGFDGVRIGQSGGLVGMRLFQMRIPNKKGGSSKETLEFLKSHEYVEFVEKQ